MGFIGKILSSSCKFKKYNKSYSFGAKKILDNNKSIKNLCKCYCYLVCIRSCRLRLEQIQSFIKKVNMGFRNKSLKRMYKKYFLDSIEIRANFFAIVSEKSIGLRMGKGKGSILSKVCPVRCGQILVVMKGRLNFFFLGIFWIGLQRNCLVIILKLYIDIKMHNNIYYLFKVRSDLIMKLNINNFNDVPKICSILIKASLGSSIDRLLLEISAGLYSSPVKRYSVLKIKKKEIFDFLCNLYYIKFSRWIFSGSNLEPLVIDESLTCNFYKNYILGYKPLYMRATENFSFLDFYKNKSTKFRTDLCFHYLFEFETKFLKRIRLFSILHNFALCSSLGMKYIFIKKEENA